MTLFHDLGFEPDDLTVSISELLVATADQSDTLIDDAVPELLRLLRERLKMDVVFVSEFVDGRRVFRRVEAKPGIQGMQPGESDPLEVTWCQRVVDGRMPELSGDVDDLANRLDIPPAGMQVGAYLSTPIVLQDGRIYGTLCCLSAATNPTLNERDLRNLKYSARLTARKIEQGQMLRHYKPQEDWSLQPIPQAPPKRR
jgi:GAF domain-containing protein